MKPTKVAALALLAGLLGAAPAARGNGIASVVVDRAGNVYFSDYVRNRIWKVDPKGNVTAAVHRHTHHLVLDENGTLYGEEVSSRGAAPELWQMTTDGTVSDVFRARRVGRTTSYQGTVFAIDRSGTLLYLRDCQIVRLNVQGVPQAWAGRRCAGQVWGSDTLRYGHLHGSLAWAPDGTTLYFSDARTVRRVASDGAVTTLSGRPTTLFADPGPDEHRFDRVMGIAVDEAGDVFVAERGDRAIHRLAPSGLETTVATLPFFWSPTGFGRAGKSLYVVANLRFPTPGFLAGMVGNPGLFRIDADGRVTALLTIRARR